MKNWLELAKEENEKFNKSEFGKLSDGKIRQIDGAITAGKVSGKKAVKSGHLQRISSKGGKAGGKVVYESGQLLKAAINGGKTQGNINANNGHCKRIAKSGGIANVKSGHIDKIRHLAFDKCSIAILQYDKNGKFIKEWKNAVEAAKYVGTSPQNINNVLNPKKRNVTAGGYCWKYKNK